jgi:BlaI family transcriptional regulator, penicillinase repressor
MATFAERELDVMNVLWTHGPSTAAEVRDALADEPGIDLAYNSVLTVLRILEDKGYVDHTVEGRAHRYAALVARADAGRSALRRLIDSLFQRSPELLLTELVRDRSLTPDTVRRLRAMLDGADDAPSPDSPPNAAPNAAPNATSAAPPPARAPRRGGKRGRAR